MASRPYSATIAGLLILPAFAACGAGAVTYSGDDQRVLLEPAQLGAGDEAPADLHRLGHVAAACELADASGGFEGVRSSDLACSPALLRAAVRERAAKAGGTFLVATECDRRGDVWGPREPAAAAAASSARAEPAWPAATLAPPFREVDEAWRALVDYWPVAEVAPRPPVVDSQVGEVDFPRPGFVRLGDVRARADGPCSLGTLRAALRAAAARVGATSVVDVRCVTSDEAPFCVASLAAPEAIESAVAEVR
jgi:hypothetical protein